MVLSFSNPLTVVAWFSWGQGKAWVKPDVESTQTRECRNPLSEGGGQYNQFANPLPVRNSGGWPQTPLAVAMGIV